MTKINYSANINAALRGDMNKYFGVKGWTPKKLRLMKLARYLSISIHGK